MTTHNNLIILKKTDSYFDVKIKIIHPVENNINDRSNFALQIILELYEKIKNGQINNCNSSSFPISKEESKKLFLKKYQQEIEGLLEKMHGKKIEISKEEYDRLSKSENLEYQDKKIISIGYNEIYYAILEREFDNFCLEAEKRIKKVELLKCNNYPHWVNRPETFLEYGHLSFGFDTETYDLFAKEPLPDYTLRIHVSESNKFLLKHIKKGCKWDSTVFDFGMHTKNFKDHRPSIKHCLRYNNSECTFDNNNLIKWWAELNSDWKGILNINLFLQQNYDYDKLHHEYGGMMTLGVFEQEHGKEYMLKIMSEEPGIKNLRLISQMKLLYASNANLKTLDPLKMLPNLILLELEINPLNDIDALEKLTKLESLTLISTGDLNPSQSSISKLEKMRDLTYDPSNQVELDSIINMPRLRTFYTILDFEPNLKVLESLSELEKIVGSSPSLDEHATKMLQSLEKDGVSISWETENGTIMSYL